MAFDIDGPNVPPAEEAPTTFFDFPYPSDLRLTPEGTPNVASFPNPGVPVLAGLKSGAQARKGFPVVPTGYFRFTGKLAPRDPNTIVDGGARAPVFLIDVDPTSPDRGKTLPVVTQTPNVDPYVPPNLLAVGPRPGIVLAPKRQYAFVVTRDIGLEGGGKPSPPTAIEALARGETPAGPRGADMAKLYAPLFATLDTVGVARTDVVVATVFTTGDVVADTSALAGAVANTYAPEITELTLEADPQNRFPGFCHLRGAIVLPQFQKGTPTFNTEGLFEFGADGLPIKQRDEKVPVSITIPRQPMPSNGYPLVLYFHGSGGVSRQLADGGDATPDPQSTWPAAALSPRGFAMAGQALPISPERVPGASDYDYINANNLVAVRDTFRQGILESRLFLSALQRLAIPPETLAGCSGPDLSESGESAYHFATNVHAQGQSMGGMYTNLVAASDPRIRLAVPTGAGGYWIYFLLQTNVIPNLGGFLSVILGTTERMSVLHPALQIGETAIEAVDPLVSANRVAYRPLPGHPSRAIYEPVGKDDSYFPTTVYDAMVLGYHHPRAFGVSGADTWPTMSDAQKLLGLDAPIGYPVRSNLAAVNGSPYTGVAVQYASDGSFDAHQIYRRVPEVIHQYGCFHESFRKTGTAVVSRPAPADAPCDP